MKDQRSNWVGTTKAAGGYFSLPHSLPQLWNLVGPDVQNVSKKEKHRNAKLNE